MKKWIHKLINQFDLDWSDHEEECSEHNSFKINDDRATLIYILDCYNKHLIEVDGHPVRKIRYKLDEFAKELMKSDSTCLERVLFRLRQFFSSYRIDEYTYVQKTLDEFRSIIWDFVDQLSEDLNYEQIEDDELQASLDELKEAVEANSIEELKIQSREFIDSYMEFQIRRDKRRNSRFNNVKKSLAVVKKRLVEANHNMLMDHLTTAFNRKSFDEQIQQHFKLAKISKQPMSMLMLDIDHFKKINDSYGHAIGDFVLIEFVKILKELFPRNADFIARIGGEEFAVLLPDYQVMHAIKKAEQTLNQIRREVFVQEDIQIKFTISIGVAQLKDGETIDQWIKRADDALYAAKNSGRDKYCVAKGDLTIKKEAS